MAPNPPNAGDASAQPWRPSMTRQPAPPVRTAPARSLPRAPQLLRLLEDLALGLDRGRDDQFGLLQLADALGTDRSHARADGAHQVQRAILGEGGTEQDLLQGARDADADPGAARQVGVRRGHAPVVAAT